MGAIAPVTPISSARYGEWVIAVGDGRWNPLFARIYGRRYPLPFLFRKFAIRANFLRRCGEASSPSLPSPFFFCCAFFRKELRKKRSCLRQPQGWRDITVPETSWLRLLFSGEVVVHLGSGLLEIVALNVVGARLPQSREDRCRLHHRHDAQFALGLQRADQLA